MSDKQQSATDFFSEKVFDLFNQLENRVISFTDFRREMRKIEFDSEELFKQQIIDAFYDGKSNGMDISHPLSSAKEIPSDQYFNETFKTESNGK